MKPQVCVLKADGINCDKETVHAFELAGAQAHTVLLNQLLENKKLLELFQILVLPGGFSYGDDIASGRLLALELEQFLADQLQEFVAQGKLILGICNGFQVLVRTGLLPGTGKTQTATLTNNVSGKFECKWVNLEVPKSNCVFTQNIKGPIMLPIAHAEGNLCVQERELQTIEGNQQIAFTYFNNSNGSVKNIAGMCDTTGRILGLMPHPERFVYPHQHPLNRQTQIDPAGLQIFKNAAHYYK